MLSSGRGEFNFKSTMQQGHPFHVLTSSKLPILVSSTAGLLALTFIMKLHNADLNTLGSFDFFTFVQSELLDSFYDFETSGVGLGDLVKSTDVIIFFLLSGLLSVIASWSANLITESNAGHHTYYVQKGLKLGMIIFLLSELMLFFPFFWAFFHGSLSPAVSIGAVWPPVGLQVLDPFMLPFVNTVVLLSSGVATVAAHRSIVAGYHQVAANAVFLAVIFGLFFSWLQFLEYGLATYTINDGLFCSVFYMLTGPHGFHVIVCSILLVIAYCRLINKNFSQEHHVGFEVAAWY